MDSFAPCTVLTPFGEHGMKTLNSVAEIIDLLDSWITPRNMICIGSGDFGATTCLSIAGLDHGHIYALDAEMKFLWDDEKLSRWNFNAEAREFFRQRDADELPPRPWGYDNCYHIADSFTDFMSKLHPAPDA